MWDVHVLLSIAQQVYHIYLNTKTEHRGHIQEVLGSNLSPENGYPDWLFHGFPLSLQVNVGIVPQIR
jgi:hypothetical protein